MAVGGCLVALLGAACGDDDGSTEEDVDVNEVRWDLREPTTTRELGSDSNDLYNVAAPIGDDLLAMTVELPGLTYRGSYDMVTAAPRRSSSSGEALPVADLTLYDDDVTSVAELRAILARFEREWGFTPESCAEVGAFLVDAESRMEAAGGDPMAVDFGPTTVVVSFGGPERNGVTPGIVVRLPPPTFSTYTLLEWDPSARPSDERPLISADGAKGDGSAGQSCLPPPS